MMREAKLILEDGTTFVGRSFGFETDTVGEAVFNTAMTGYPESLTDPSYAGQILVMTYPLIGNYGVPDTDLGGDGLPLFMESERIHVKALVVADYSEAYSHWNARESLAEWLKRERIPAITGIDTRRLTMLLREHGVMMGKISLSPKGEGSVDTEDYGSVNWVEQVSCKEVITYKPDSLLFTLHSSLKRVVLVDCGVKANIIRCLVRRGIEVVRVPWNYDFNQLDFDGLFLANGPGDPERCGETVAHIADIHRYIRPEDVPVLLSVGKDHIYIWENNENMLHENDAAYILRDLCMNENMRATEPREGKIELIAETDGLFLVDVERLRAVNSLGDMMIAARSSGFMVHKGEHLCGTRVIPLVIEKERMERAREAAGETPIMRLVPAKAKKYGVVTTGNEVFYGRIEDTFTPVIEEKLSEFGCEMKAHVILNDDHEKITEAVLTMLDEGCEMVFCSGGMSVDPDDKTPLAIRNTGADIVSYGAPVLPGAMFLVSYMDDGRPVCGLPGCVMYARRTIFDLVLPYLVTDTPVTKEWLAGLGNGGFCLNCPVCHFPNCSFGKGI